MAAQKKTPSPQFEASESFARGLDEKDPLRAYRERFCIPTDRDGKPVIYFCGNSLGLMPKAAKDAVEQELEDWARLGVDAHFDGRSPWYRYHEQFREAAARLVGAKPGEVVMMNSLTVNLHLMLATFYRPTRSRYKILIDTPCFPSDMYAVKSQAAMHRFDPNDAVVMARPREGEHCIHTGDIESVLEDHGDMISLVLLAGVNFFTGQHYDLRRIIAMAKREGCVVGLDLAHAAGNVPLALHDWDVDFAVWCSYKYLNCGPGAVAGCYVNERHAGNPSLPRLAGWWGNDPASRFQMHLLPDFVPVSTADAWQVSNPPIFSMAPLRASLAIFDEAGMPALRAKSELLTGYLRFLIEAMPTKRYEIITPKDPAAHGCQLSILAQDDAKGLFKRLEAAGIKGDFREPNVIRVAPVPLYNTFHEVWRFAQVLAEKA